MEMRKWDERKMGRSWEKELIDCVQRDSIERIDLCDYRDMPIQ